MKANNTGYIIGAYPVHPLFTKEVKRKRRYSGDNYQIPLIFVGWNNPAWKTSTRWATNGCYVIRQKAGDLSSPL